MQTREEFVQALINSGTFDPALDEARRWGGHYTAPSRLKVGHYPDHVLIDGTKYHKCSCKIENSDKRLQLDVFQTRAQFEAELRKCGIID